MQTDSKVSSETIGIVTEGFLTVDSSISCVRPNDIQFNDGQGKTARLFWKDSQLCFEGDFDYAAEELFLFLSKAWDLYAIRNRL